MNLPRLSRRQREAFSAVYAQPRTVMEVARLIGVRHTNARELLALLEFHDLVRRDGLMYRPAEWTVTA